MKKSACLVLACMCACGCVTRRQDALRQGVLSRRTPGEVSFVVVSGAGEIARPAEAVAQFSAGVDRCNAAGADFAVVLSDVTGRPALDEAELARQWNTRDGLCRRLAMPHILVPGDRDIWGQASGEQWLTRYGRMYFSWDLGHAHFIVLCSEVPGQAGRIAGDQLAWLRKDLAESSQGKRTFVFVHRPLWTAPADRQGRPNAWNADVHPLLARYGVDTVFAGHQRRYCLHPTRDNVRYVVAGGGLDRYELAGEFEHVVKVTALPSQAKLAVITPRGTLPPECAMAEPIEMMRKALKAAVSVPAGKTGQLELTVSVPNPTDSPAQAVLLWDRPGSTWTPVKAQADVPARQQTDILAKAAYTRLLSLPEAKVELRSGDRRLFGWRDILAPAIGVAAARRAKVADVPKLHGIRIDGDAWDWAEAGLHVEALSTIGRGVALRGVSAAQCRLGWNAEGLLVMVNVRDEAIADGDAVELCVSSSPGSADVYCLTVAAPGEKGAPTQTSFRAPGKPRALAGRVVARRTDAGYAVEALLPWSNIALAPKAGRTIGVQVMVNDVDGEAPRVRMGWYPLGHPLSAVDGFSSICTVRLAERASEVELFAIRAGTVLPLGSSVEIAAPAGAAGETVAVKQGDKTLAQETLRLQAGQARAELTLALSPKGAPVGTVDVYVGDEKIETVDLGRPDDAQ